MNKALLLLFVLGCGTVFAETHFSVGIGIGGYGPAYGPVYAPAPPPPPVYDVPPCPGEGYVWVDGFWNSWGGRYHWRPGYWRAPAYFGYRGYGGYGYRDRGYEHGYYERGGHGWDHGNHFGRYHNEFRHGEGRGRHEGNDWRR